MESSFLVYDDFFDRPDKARETALSLTYPEPPPEVYYPGRNSRESMAWPGHEEMFSRIIGRPLVALGQSHGCARLTLASDKRRGRVHVDPGCNWAGIIYLTPDEYAQGGTDFFRNRRFGTDRAPLTDEEAQEIYGKPTPRDALIDILTVENGSDPDEWELIGSLPMKFNRLILFRPWFWHSSGDGFGDSIENGRLIMLLFFAPSANAVNARIVPPL
jgi:Family of unknown function (DUF6445)